MKQIDHTIKRHFTSTDLPEFKWLGKLIDHFYAPYERQALSPEERRAISDAAANWSGSRQNDVGHVPEDLEPWARKAAIHGYRIMDRDIEKLHAAGRSDDEIFEATLSAVLGSGLARLEKGLSALDESAPKISEVKK